MRGNADRFAGFLRPRIREHKFSQDSSQVKIRGCASDARRHRRALSTRSRDTIAD